MNKRISLITVLLFLMPHTSHSKPPRIIGLMPARNEANILAQSLKALACYTDAIVYLDDASTDNSVEIAQSLAAECNIEKIIQKSTWYRDEPGDRNALLQAGREIQGTHFIVLDADEMFTSNCQDDDYLRKIILQLLPGEMLTLNWIQLWRSTKYYRFDESVWTWNYGSFIFCDDGVSSYNSEFIHTSRIPNIVGATHRLKGSAHGVLHFQFVNWNNLLIKQAWYRCLELIRTQKSAQEINTLYAPSKNETNLGLKAVQPEWFNRYNFFDSSAFNKPEQWRQAQILGWFKQYGCKHFAELDIWDINWGIGSQL